jgi:Skp family chaperone for outer membrane proteins
MKKTVLMLMVAGLLAAMPVVAAEDESAGEHVQRCVLQSEAIGNKIERLQKEVKAGKMKNYSAEELRNLEEKLSEANYMLDSITRP